jgi:hypothetical protein
VASACSRLASSPARCVGAAVSPASGSVLGR